MDRKSIAKVPIRKTNKTSLGGLHFKASYFIVREKPNDRKQKCRLYPSKCIYSSPFVSWMSSVVATVYRADFLATEVDPQNCHLSYVLVIEIHLAWQNHPSAHHRSSDFGLLHVLQYELVMLIVPFYFLPLTLLALLYYLHLWRRNLPLSSA